MPDTPVTTFTLETEKKQNDSEIKWEAKINNELLSNGIWKLEIKSVAFTEMVNYVKREPSTSQVHWDHAPVFEISCNLVTNNLKWFEHIIGTYSQKQSYKSLYPIEYVQLLSWEKSKEQLILLKSKKHRIATPNTDEVIITMKPVSSKYKFDDVACKCAVMLSLYKE